MHKAGTEEGVEQGEDEDADYDVGIGTFIARNRVVVRRKGFGLATDETAVAHINQTAHEATPEQSAGNVAGEVDA